MTNRLDGDVLELVGNYVAAAAELLDGREVVVGGDDLLVGDLPAG